MSYSRERLQHLLKVWSVEAAQNREQLRVIEDTYNGLTQWQAANVPEPMRCYLMARSARLSEIAELDDRRIAALRATLEGDDSDDLPPMLASLLEDV